MSQEMQHDITGVILIGGKSRRMGRDKAFLEFGGKPLFERVLRLFRENFAHVLLVGNAPERFAGYGLEVVPDSYPGSPLGGIYTALRYAGTGFVFVSSCDLPFPSVDILRYLCSIRDGYDAVVPMTRHGYEPLFALYSRNCLEPIHRQLESGDFCAYAWYPQVRVRYVSPEELDRLDPEGKAFRNINTPEEFAAVADPGSKDGAEKG